MLPNTPQVTGAADRIVIAALMYGVGKGWIGADDVANIAAFIITVGGAGYSFYVNRNTNLAKQAAAIPNTVVVTTPEIANATPHQDNIVSISDVAVVQKP